MDKTIALELPQVKLDTTRNASLFLFYYDWSVKLSNAATVRVLLEKLDVTTDALTYLFYFHILTSYLLYLFIELEHSHALHNVSLM